MLKIQVNEKVTNLGTILNSCYVVVEEITINKDIMYISLLVYKSKTDYETNVSWNIKVDEIKQLLLDNKNNSSFDFASIIITNLCKKNTSWNENNLIIE